MRSDEEKLCAYQLVTFNWKSKWIKLRSQKKVAGGVRNHFGRQRRRIYPYTQATLKVIYSTLPLCQP